MRPCLYTHGEVGYGDRSISYREKELSHLRESSSVDSGRWPKVEEKLAYSWCWAVSGAVRLLTERCRSPLGRVGGNVGCKHGKVSENWRRETERGLPWSFGLASRE